MELQYLASKLEPLEPRAVSYWKHVREHADSEYKILLDEALLSLADKRLPNWHNKMLLSLPPRDSLKGSIQLGTVVYNEECWPAALTKEEFLKGVGIYGMTGSGKTNIVFSLLLQLMDHSVPWLFVDFKRTGRHLLPKLKERVQVYTPGRELSPFPFNPFVVPPGLDSNVYVSIVGDLMARAYEFKEAGKFALQKALRQCYISGNKSPTVEDLISSLRALDETEVSRHWKLSVLRSLEAIEFARLSSKASISQDELAQLLLNNCTILEVDSLTDSGKAFLLPLLSLWLYYVKLSDPRREQLSFCLFYEEAHNILYGSDRASKESPIAMILRQARELGIAIVVVDQHPHLISSAALGNAYTTILLNLKDPADTSKAAALSLSDQDYFSMLPVGHGIVKLQGRWQRPFLVRFPLIPVNKGGVTDKEVSKYINGESLSPLSGSITSKTSERRHFHSLDSLSFEARSLLQDITTYPIAPLVSRFKRHGLSCKRGERLKEELLELGLIQADRIRVGNTLQVILTLAPEGRQLLGLPSCNEGAEHLFWKHYYANVLSSLGYRVQLEAPRPVGNTDLSAEWPQGSPYRIAIEVETGSNGARDILHNIKQDQAARFHKILVVASNEQAKRRVERIVVEEGLHGVRVLLRNDYRKADFAPAPGVMTSHIQHGRQSA